MGSLGGIGVCRRHVFGRGALRDYTPCRFEDDGELATSLAVVHGASS